MKSERGGSLIDVLRRSCDSAVVARAYAPVVERFFGDGTEILDVSSWRILPMRSGGFAVMYTLRTTTDEAAIVAAVLSDETPTELAGSVPVGDLGHYAFTAERDPRMPALAHVLAEGSADGGTAELVAYRPLGRATVRRRDSAGRTTYVRLSASSRRFARVRRLAEVAAAMSVDGRRLFPLVLEAWPERNGLVVESRAGRLLHHSLGAVSPDDIGAIDRCLGGLERIDPNGLPRHQALDEAEATSWMLRHGALVRPELLTRIDDDLGRLYEVAANIEDPSPRVLHRDLHDKQIVFGDDGEVSLLDTDTLAAGDPLVDRINLAVHLELRELQGRLVPGRAASLERELVETMHGGDRSFAIRRGFYAACTWLRLAGVYALRSHGESIIPRALSRARIHLHSLTRSAKETEASS